MSHLYMQICYQSIHWYENGQFKSYRDRHDNTFKMSTILIFKRKNVRNLSIKFGTCQHNVDISVGLVPRLGTCPQNLKLSKECRFDYRVSTCPQGTGFSTQYLLIHTQCELFHKATTIYLLFHYTILRIIGELLLVSHTVEPVRFGGRSHTLW